MAAPDVVIHQLTDLSLLADPARLQEALRGCCASKALPISWRRRCSPARGV